MDIFRRSGSPYWYVDYSVGGERRKESTKRTNKKEARVVAQEMLRAALDKRQLRDHGEVISMHDAIELYAQRLTTKSTASAKTAVFTRQLLNGHLRLPEPPIKMDMLAHEVKTKHYTRVRVLMESAGYSPHTIKNTMSFIRSSLLHAGDLDYRVSTAKADTPKARPRLRFLLGDEEACLIREAHPETRSKGSGRGMSKTRQQLQWEIYDLIVFLLDTGCRYSEATHVTWLSVDTDRWRYVNLHRLKFGPLSNVMMTDRLQEVLQRRREANPTGTHVFNGRGGGNNRRSYSTNGLVSTYRRAGLNTDDKVRTYGTFTTHSLRHSFATKLIQNGASLEDVQVLLGHANSQQTLVYAHLDPQRSSAAAVSILNRLAERDTQAVTG